MVRVKEQELPTNYSVKNRRQTACRFWEITNKANIYTYHKCKNTWSIIKCDPFPWKEKNAVIIHHNNIIKDLVSIHTAFLCNVRVINHPKMQLFYTSLGGTQVGASATLEPGNYRMVTCEQLLADRCGKPLRLNTNTAVKYRLLTAESKQQTK